MVNKYQSSRRLENDNKHEHGEHLVSKKTQKKTMNMDTMTTYLVVEKKKDDNKHEHNEHLMSDIRKPRNDDKHELYEYGEHFMWTTQDQKTMMSINIMKHVSK